MKKIDELFDDYEVNDDLDIKPSVLDDIELKRIKNLTFEKAGIKIAKKSTNKRIILPLIAVMSILILSMAVVSANTNIESIFGDLFSGGYEYIENCSDIVDVYDIDNDLKLSIDGIIGDENTCYIKFTMERLDGKTFDCSYAFFDNVGFDFRGSGGFSYTMLEDEDKTDNKISFLLDLSITSGFRNKKIEFNIRDLWLYLIDENNVFNPHGYLQENEKLINQDNIVETNVNLKKEELNNDSLSAAEKGKITTEIYSIEQALGRGDLGLGLIKDSDKLAVDNIGFVNNMLNIRVYLEDEESYDIGKMVFKHKETDEELYSYIVSSEENGKQYKTYIFDIENMEELKNYTFTCSAVETKDKLIGNWNLKFKPNYKPTIKEVNVNKSIELDGEKYSIKDVKISPISIVIDIRRNLFDKINKPVNHDIKNIMVILDDESTVKLNGANVSSNLTEICIIKQFESPVDIEAIREIIIEGYSINIK